MEPCPVIVAGLGFRAATSEEDLSAALMLAGCEPDLIATLAAKAEVRALQAVARRLGIRVIGVPETALAGVSTATRSDRIIRRFGTGSLAEAAALVAAGPGARLIRPRIVSGPVTLALAEAREEQMFHKDGKGIAE